MKNEKRREKSARSPGTREACRPTCPRVRVVAVYQHGPWLAAKRCTGTIAATSRQGLGRWCRRRNLDKKRRSTTLGCPWQTKRGRSVKSQLLAQVGACRRCRPSLSVALHDYR